VREMVKNKESKENRKFVIKLYSATKWSSLLFPCRMEALPLSGSQSVDSYKKLPF